VIKFILYGFEISDFWICPLILNSHLIKLIKACICFRRKIYNQENARHTAVVHYTRKHLRSALQLLVQFKLFTVVILHICATFEGYCC